MADLAALDVLVRAAGERASRVQPMTGGASTRKYFRVDFERGGSAVAMYVPDGDRPEEKSHETSGSGRPWPFLEVRDLLQGRGVRVPRLLAEDTRAGWLLLEDLGDTTLAVRLEERPDDRDPLYRRAVLDLLRAQRALAELPGGSVVAQRAFDEELLRWELDHFREFGLDARGKSLAPDERTRMDGIFDRLARRVALLPRAFVHRDYQSKNLMVVGDELVWIDFQDALLGPRAYDLVALLHDSYQTWDDAFVDARLEDYAEAAGLRAGEREELVRQFQAVAVQRKLKDAGRFVFIDRVKKNPAFLPYVAPTLRRVGRTIDRLAAEDPDMADLQGILRRALGDEVRS